MASSYWLNIALDQAEKIGQSVETLLNEPLSIGTLADEIACIRVMSEHITQRIKEHIEYDDKKA